MTESDTRKIERIFGSLTELIEIKNRLARDGECIDQNLRSWINALTYALSDIPMILGKSD